MNLWHCVGVLILTVAGCASGAASFSSPMVLVRGLITYEGSKEYLPRTVEESPSEIAGISIRYDFEINQGVLANDLESVKVFAQLDVLNNKEVKHSYRAARTLTGNYPWWSFLCCGRPETLTVLRRKALLEVRDEIEQQMIKNAASGKLP